MARKKYGLILQTPSRSGFPLIYKAYCTIPTPSQRDSKGSPAVSPRVRRCPPPISPGDKPEAFVSEEPRSQPRTPSACKAALIPQISAEKLPVRHSLTVVPDLLEIFRKESSILLTEPTFHSILKIKQRISLSTGGIAYA